MDTKQAAGNRHVQTMNASLKQFARNAFNRTDASSVALVSSRPQLHEALKRALKSDDRFHYLGVRGDLPQIGPQIGAGALPAILVIDLQDGPDASIAAIEGLRSAGFNGAVITLSDSLDETTVRGLLRLRVLDWLRSDARTEQIVEACERALNARKLADRQSTATCVALVPAAGGVGTTTLAIQTAYLLGKRARDFTKTCLIDLNFQSGSMTDYLDLQPLFDFETIATDPSRLDAQLLEVMLARHASGLAILAAPRAPTEPPRVDGKLVASTLSMVAETFEHMVLDLPPVWMPWTFDVLAGSDQIFVVTEFTVPAMRQAHDLAEAMAARLGNEIRIGVIVNKFRRQLFGGLRKGDAAGLLGDRLAGFVPEAYEVVSEAINRGEIVGAMSRSNHVNRELARIVLNG